MTTSPEARFLSLFVPDLAAAAKRYETVFGVAPSPAAKEAPNPHPFAPKGPVVFDLGGVKLALYQCDGRTTHPGDVGIGVVAGDGLGDMAERAREQGGQVFYGPRKLPDDGRQMAVFMLPDRHFFEVFG